MQSHKRCIQSVLLNRMAHADVFEVDARPRWLFLLFGGSGVDDDEYLERSKTTIPIFGRVLDYLAKCGVDLVLIHVTAPYDVPFNRFSADPSSADTWNCHVLSELIEPWSRLPFFVCGFSGGAALALNGVHEDRRCFGGAGLGADGIPPDFACPAHWKEKLRLYAAPDDVVCNHPANRRVVEVLERRGQAEEVHLASGGHRLTDYSTVACLGELIRFAAGKAPGM